MAYKVKFKKGHKINGIDYKKGDVLVVSTSIYNDLNDKGIASATVPKKKKED